MKITRSTKCYLKDTSTKKKELLQHVLSEYGRVVNVFINHFWKNGSVSKSELLKPIVDLPDDSWLSARLRKVAAREALDMISSCKEVHQSNRDQLELTIKSLRAKIKSIPPDSKQNRRRLNQLSCKLRDKTNRFEMFQPTKPKHTGNRMNVSCTIADLQESKSKEFDAWLHLTSIGNKVKLDLPIRFHDHYNRLASRGKRLNAYIIKKDSVQFCFEIETGEKKEVKKILGIDTGINALASTSDGEQFGTDVKSLNSKCKRKKWGSNGHRRASNALRQRINEVAKEIVSSTDLVVVEKLKNMNNNSKLKGLNKSLRHSIGSWNYSYWLERLQLNCEMNRVSFRSVSPYYTSQTCPTCGHVDRKNRCGEKFQCQECDQTGNADCVAAWNILKRFILGTYGSQYKSLISTETCSFL